MARIAFSRSLSDSPRDWLAKCRRADEVGLPTAWAADVPGADCIVYSTLALSVTSRLRAGAAIALPVRTPLQMATALNLLAQLGDGRVIVGFGAGDPSYLGSGHDVPFGPPVARMREYYTAVTTLHRSPSGEPVAFDGAYRQAHGLGFGVPAERVSTIVGAHGPAMARLAGRIADGLVIEMLTPLDVQRQRIESARAERPTGAPFFSAAGMVVSLDEEEGEALRRARAEMVAAFLIPLFRPRYAELTGEEAADRVQALVDSRRFSEAAALLPEEIVRSFIIVTTPKRFVETVAAIDVVDEVIPVPVGVWSPLAGAELGTPPADLAKARQSVVDATLGYAG